MAEASAELERQAFRDKWKSLECKRRENEYTSWVEIEILCATWNVNVKKPTEDLTAWLNTSHQPGIVAIGIQEMDMSAEGVIFREMESRNAPWEALFLESLNKQHEDEIYSQVTNCYKDQGNSTQSKILSKQLGGVHLVCFVHQKFRDAISEVQTSGVVTGILGVVANKGGVGIRFRLFDSTFVFLNAHFNAHQTNVETRNQDFLTIESGLQFWDPLTVKDTVTGNEELDMGVPMPLYDHDNIFWVGDFNYRIDLPDDFVRERIEKKDWDTLFAADQLHVQKKRGKVFQNGWEEAPIKFPPTYKYESNSTQYDNSSKRRCPAWCDRILWRSSYTTNQSYERFELLSSDHRPVSARFSVKVKVLDHLKKLKVIEDIVRQLDESVSSPPATELTASEIEFKNLQFGVTRTKTVTLSNVGCSIVQWKFIPKLKDQHVFQCWLNVTPTTGMLGPGEEVQIVFSGCVGRKQVQKLMEETKINDVVVLHVENEMLNGKDYFITVTGNWLKSVFGKTLNVLVTLPFPVRSGRTYPSLKLKVPKELWCLCDWLYKYGIRKPGIFIEPGKKPEMENLRECLDTGREFPPTTDAHSMAETLLYFLNCFREPLVPYEFYSQALNVCGNFTLCKQVVSKFPEHNYNVFYYLTAFLREFLVHSLENNLTPEKLTCVFSRVIFKTPPELKALQTEGLKLEETKKRSSFVLHFLIPLNHMRAESQQ
eukprot:TRINITY_DN242_c0_g4_i1.p1 TRINITY_DN242_c0_g4~~TRINITY_DN242_c0_g4_i1.p1  ORF type:complete len:735 (-),score=133.08 TRINITY_DN242_c0_g4_i1:40-2172(-)